MLRKKPITFSQKVKLFGLSHKPPRAEETVPMSSTRNSSHACVFGLTVKIFLPKKKTLAEKGEKKVSIDKG